jgi:Acetyltransferase (GNAT) domain
VCRVLASGEQKHLADRPQARAELLADRGEGARGGDFFASGPFLAAEKVTHTLVLRTSAGEFVAPLIVTPIPGSEARDATSPYGFPGLKGPAGIVLDHSAIDLRETGLVSIFLRHRIGPAPITGTTTRNTVYLYRPETPIKLHQTDRRQIRLNRSHYRTELVNGPMTSRAQLESFHAVYLETMHRRGAVDRYKYPLEYFEAALRSDRSWLFLTRTTDGSTAAVSLSVESDGYLHYYLSGSSDRHYADAPMKTLIAEVLQFSVDRKMPVNFGGGLRPGDGLEQFKSGFANDRTSLHTSELIGDPDEYARLSAATDVGDFFPAYRANLPRGAPSRREPPHDG